MNEYTKRLRNLINHMRLCHKHIETQTTRDVSDVHMALIEQMESLIAEIEVKPVAPYPSKKEPQ